MILSFQSPVVCLPGGWKDLPQSVCCLLMVRNTAVTGKTMNVRHINPRGVALVSRYVEQLSLEAEVGCKV
jgi:hypothetical protein